MELLLHNMDLPKRYKSCKFQEMSPESLNNAGFQDNSIQDSNEFSIEKYPNFIEHVYYENNVTKHRDDLESMAAAKDVELSTVKHLDFANHNYIMSANKKEDFELTSKINVTHAESVPFLAAIFETVGNVTAQTCGGVVLSPHWVLTAAGCVNVLGPFYTNSSNETTDASYTVVAGANDPLKDGTVHQVSKIYLHPSTNRSRLHWLTMDKNVPTLALLRVEQGVKGGVEVENGAWSGEGRIYSWILKQKQTGFEMTAVSSPARQLSPQTCKKLYGVSEDNTSICLSVNETKNITRMTSGCPVVALREGRISLLAVALTDNIQPLLATPLALHRDWLNKLTREDGKDENKVRK
ncbi:chymotrypsin-like elastase family member 1 [Leguminivora glycinivorella]|uniref:chymotrypsin-like elastase family member 1 n=1 Tax=Leguminivora glycinivorella TaxID=1035111 RepID=UPI00200CBB65|nr:chymotrypsin-like elastase family member 1 [Leguminivora glycinivorella]